MSSSTSSGWRVKEIEQKAPLALPLANPIAAELWAESGPHGHMKYDATCGAGLPVISTLQTLLATGDEVIEIQGALSGTLGAIFSMVAAGQSFSYRQLLHAGTIRNQE
jgi:homoserine dehydrogenase